MFDLKFVPTKTEKDTWLAGYDCAKNGANSENSHFSFFVRSELTKAWEKGNKSYKWEKEIGFVDCA